jgi:hypothetical protein
MFKKYVGKPVVVEAVQWDGSMTQAAEIVSAIGGTHAQYMDEMPDFIHIQTLEGLMRASPQDWIIRGTRGEYYPCKPDVFEKKYEEYDL